jgi:hypothetical protein
MEVEVEVEVKLRLKLKLLQHIMLAEARKRGGGVWGAVARSVWLEYLSGMCFEPPDLVCFVSGATSTEEESERLALEVRDRTRSDVSIYLITSQAHHHHTMVIATYEIRRDGWAARSQLSWKASVPD